MTVREALRMAAARLTAAGVPDPKLDAEYLLAETLRLGRLELLLNKQRALTAAEQGAFEALLEAHRPPGA